MKLNSKAFTLIELLVVVLIIGILAAVAVPQYQIAVEKSIASEGISLVRSLVVAQEAYRLANGDYTDDILQLDLDFPGTDSKAGSVNSKVTKHFSCRAHENSTSNNTIALCRRTHKYSYYLTSQRSYGINQMICAGDNERDTQWCKRLTGKETAPYLF